MLLSVLLYGGLFAAIVGAFAMLWRRTRRRAMALFATGIAFVLIALLWPAGEERVTTAASKLDEIMPRWQFVERHEIRIAAPPERIYSAIRDVTASEIRFFQILTAIRCMGRCAETESILNAPAAKPILDVALRSGFRMLVDDAPRELVIGTRVAPRTLAVMNFHIDGDGFVTTETRVFAETNAARRKFAIYWRFIRPGSGIIRRSWLEAIKRRAEAKGTGSRGERGEAEKTTSVMYRSHMPHRYPQEAVLRDGRRVLLRPFAEKDVDALFEFFQHLPVAYRRFAWDHIENRALIESWGRDIDYAKVLPILALDGHRIVADATLHRRLGGPLRLTGRIKWMIDPNFRGVGLGTLLVNQFIGIARENGLRHLNAMLISDLEADAVTTLQNLGFTSYVMPGYGTDPDGNQHDMTKLILKL